MTDAVRTTITQLCDELVSADSSCFSLWCQIWDGRGRPSPAAVVASQEPLHWAAGELRRTCLANAGVAEAARQELMRIQVEGEIRHGAEVKRARMAAAREVVRRRWAGECRRIFESRDAITVGLGWPHRGELVTVTTSYGRDGEELEVTGTGVYLYSYDIFNVTHMVWVPQVSADRHAGSLLVAWEPCQGRWGNADPAGGIGLRVKGAETRPLPVPLPRWPKPQDIEGGPDPVSSTPVGGQLELFAAPETSPPQERHHDHRRRTGPAPRWRMPGPGPGPGQPR